MEGYLSRIASRAAGPAASGADLARLRPPIPAVPIESLPLPPAGSAISGQTQPAGFGSGEGKQESPLPDKIPMAAAESAAPVLKRAFRSTAFRSTDGVHAGQMPATAEATAPDTSGQNRDQAPFFPKPGDFSAGLQPPVPAAWEARNRQGWQSGLSQKEHQTEMPYSGKQGYPAEEPAGRRILNPPSDPERVLMPVPDPDPDKSAPANILRPPVPAFNIPVKKAARPETRLSPAAGKPIQVSTPYPKAINTGKLVIGSIKVEILPPPAAAVKTVTQPAQERYQPAATSQPRFNLRFGLGQI